METDHLYGLWLHTDELARRRARLRRQNFALGLLAFALAGMVGLTPIALMWLDVLP